MSKTLTTKELLAEMEAEARCRHAAAQAEMSMVVRKLVDVSKAVRDLSERISKLEARQFSFPSAGDEKAKWMETIEPRQTWVEHPLPTVTTVPNPGGEPWTVTCLTDDEVKAAKALREASMQCGHAINVAAKLREAVGY